MYFGKNKSILIIGTVVLLLIIVVAVISTFWPKYEERFFELGLLGKDQTADGYFPNNNSTIQLGSQISCYLYIHNHMGDFQEVSIRVKLLNSTIGVPNDREHRPSPVTPFAEFPLSLSLNETLIVPFSWSILEMDSQNSSVILKRLMVNEKTVEVEAAASSDSFFRIVFELWVYDQSSREYKFGWKSGNEFFSASLNIGFDVGSLA